MQKMGMLEIVGTLSECSTSVQVKNQIIGATVELRVAGNATPIGGGTATWPNQSFPVNAATPLKAGQKIIAIQKWSTITDSDPSPSVTVDPPPTPALLSIGQFFTPFYVCTQCVWLTGLFPGAKVVVFSNNNESLGDAEVGGDGQAHVDLKRALTGDDNLTALQNACQGAATPASAPIVGGRPQPMPAAPLDAPIVQPPLVCDRFISVSGMRPGAQVTLLRGPASIGTFCAPQGFVNVVGLDPLHLTPSPPDNPITATQFFGPPCNLGSADTRMPLTNDPIKAPKIAPPVCAGQTLLTVTGLRLGATVEITTSTGDIYIFGASAVVASFSVSPLAAGVVVSVRQNICGSDLTWSAVAQATVGAVVPAKPLLKVPINGASNMPVKPHFYWGDGGTLCNFAQAYEIQVANGSDPNFGSPLATMTQSGTDVVWSIALAFSKKFLWRVRALRSGQPNSAWSTAFVFTTAATVAPPPPPPPEDNDTVKDRCFCQDCTPISGPAIIHAYGTYNQALADALKKAPSGCTVGPLEVPCDKKASDVCM